MVRHQARSTSRGGRCACKHPVSARFRAGRGETQPSAGGCLEGRDGGRSRETIRRLGSVKAFVRDSRGRGTPVAEGSPGGREICQAAEQSPPSSGYRPVAGFVRIVEGVA
jgi:hypothetical protein